ncbi:hypothetical protein SAMN05216483_2342 [Streptomyces sp. 2131.1]|uniref:hypothetical protein n=1 Tax=Streptomyces sp. 2131.1 TaxID=1855346 RepID=UPI00089A8822|nr:hypothetical protein [Streptomyces sp. 2131.1]SEC75751.1 hypothetical protein SAMN05216483_2342 [Streptomyces sp. 2131.1]
MRRRLVHGLAAGWVVLAGAGWGATQWLGEPTATSGPAPVTPPSSAAEPGPQPEFDCAEAVRAAQRSPSPSGAKADRVPKGGGVNRLTVVACDYSTSER